MVDKVDVKTRSKIMAKVKSGGNKSTEMKMQMLMVRAGIRGWKIHPKDTVGHPDFILPIHKIAIFVDGCFWHGCPVCQKKLPEANHSYWERKIARNVELSHLYNQQLSDNGWVILRIWEHELKKPNTVIERLKDAINENS